MPFHFYEVFQGRKIFDNFNIFNGLEELLFFTLSGFNWEND